MDHFSKRIDTLLQESQQSAGLSGAAAQRDASRAVYNPGTSSNMSGMTQSYASANQASHLGLTFNQRSSYGPYGVYPYGVGVASSSQNFGYQPYGPNKNAISGSYSNRETLLSQGSSLARYGIDVSRKSQSTESSSVGQALLPTPGSAPNTIAPNWGSHHAVSNTSNNHLQSAASNSLPLTNQGSSLARYGINVSGKSQSAADKTGFRQALLPTPGSTSSTTATAVNNRFEPQSLGSMRKRIKSPPKVRKALLPTPGHVDSAGQERGKHLAGGSLFNTRHPEPTEQDGGNRSRRYETNSPVILSSSSSEDEFEDYPQSVSQHGSFQASRFGRSRSHHEANLLGRSRSPVSSDGRFGGSIAQSLHAENRRTIHTSRLQGSGHRNARGEDVVSGVSWRFDGNKLARDVDDPERNLPVPDGTGTIRYPPPDVKNLLFDSVTGYRFDPTTGLHYDANSGFYLNHKLRLLLRWDPLTSTYMVVSNNPSGLAPPAASLLNSNPNPTSAVAGLSSEELKALARELAPLLKPGGSERSVEYDRRRRDVDRFGYETRRRRHDRTDPYPSDPKRYNRRSPQRRTSRDPEYRGRRERDSRRYYARVSSDDAASGEDTDEMSDDRPAPGNHPPSAGGGETPPSRQRWQSLHTLTVPEIHEDNLKDSRNLFGSCFPEYLPSAYILAAPLPSSEEMKKGQIVNCLQRFLLSDAPNCRSIRVFQGDFGAPCNYALIRFGDEEEAVHWYKLQRGTIKFRTPTRDFVTFMFFAEDNWFCCKRRPEDKCCQVPTPNFPFRSLCYKCYEPRSKLDMPPIVKDPFPTPWIGILQLDCMKFSRIDDVLAVLPVHQGIKIESMEFLREPSGLPIGACAFHILDIEESKQFFEILTKADFSVSYIRVNKQALDFPRASSQRRVQGPIQGRNRPGLFQSRSSQCQSEPRDSYPRSGPSSVEKAMTASLGDKKKPKGNRKRARDRLGGMFSEILGKDFTVVDECSDDGETQVDENPEPFLRPKPLRQLLADQLKNVATLHTKNCEDPDNILRSLLPDPPAVRGIILLAPVPSGDRDSVKGDIVKVLTADKADFSRVDIYQGKGSGAPCHYSLITFVKPRNALSWYSKRNGVVNLNENFKSFMFFSSENWVCRECKFANFPLRSWCNRCFNGKLGAVNPSAVSEAPTPTRFLGISSRGLPIDTPETGFTKENILHALEDDVKTQVVSCEMILEEKELPGLCVLEAQDDKDASAIRTHLVSKGWRPFFLRMSEELGPSAAPASTDNPSNAPVDAPENLPSDPRNASEDLPAKLPNNNVKYDPMKHMFDNSMPSRFIMLSPSPSINETILKQLLEKFFADDGVSDCSSYVIGRPDKVGSPHDYIQVTFTDLDKARNWYDKHSGHMELTFPGIFPNQEVKFGMQMFYSETPNWSCRSCNSSNFPLRSLCCMCFLHRYEECSTPATISNVPTRWVGITHLRRTIYQVDQVKKILPPLDSFNISRMVLVKEPNPLLHVGLCVIETPSTVIAQELMEFVKIYDKKLRLVFMNLESPAEEMDATQTTKELSVSPMIAFFSDQVADNTDRLPLWWQAFQQGVEEGEDMLKKLFQDQNLMPNPAAGSVFVPVPPAPPAPAAGRQYFTPLLEESGVDPEVAEFSKFFHGKNVGGPSSYFILDFDTPADADAWRAKHNGKWVITFENGKTWVSHVHVTAHNWVCKTCCTPNFPPKLYCIWCFKPRDGGSPIVSISEAPTKFVGVSRFQNWCASEEVLLESVKTIADMKSTGKLKKVHYPSEPSRIPLGLCVLEFEDIADAQRVFIQLIALTQKRHVIMYLEGNSFGS